MQIEITIIDDEYKDVFTRHYLAEHIGEHGADYQYKAPDIDLQKLVDDASNYKKMESTYERRQLV